jgi:hypothetical protein
MVLLGVAALIAGPAMSAVTGSAAGLTIASAALTVYRTCVLTASPATTSVVADTEVRQSNTGTNYGTQSTMTITSSGTANRRAYIWFDMTACDPVIPATATVRLATLRLYPTVLPSVCQTYDIFAAKQAWTETAITWANQPFGTTLNAPASGTRTDSFDAGTPTGCENRTTGVYTVGATVTGDVAAVVAGQAANAGWMIRNDVEGATTARTITVSAKQQGTLAQAPQLVITYVVIE